MAIQQHPLPQDISSYRFRLIGDMTIKQFASLGISIVLAIISYSLPLPFFFKYPLSFMFIVLGVGMAFVPVQGRSLDVWILAFIRSIYSPTQFVWKKSTDSVEMNMSSSSTAGTQAVSNANIQLTQAPVSKPEIPTETVPNTPTISITPPSAEEKPVDQTTDNNTQQTTPQEIIVEKDIAITPTTLTTTEETPVPDLGRITPNITLNIPPSPTITTPPKTEESASPTQISQPSEQKQTPHISAQAPTTPPQQSQLPVPFTPTTPNTLVGLTLNPEGKILDGVMVEIQRNGLTSRATKSNKLGQFMFARPLENGLYQILAEKDSYTFSPYSLDLTGEIIRPLKIQAQ